MEKKFRWVPTFCGDSCKLGEQAEDQLHFVVWVPSLSELCIRLFAFLAVFQLLSENVSCLGENRFCLVFI